MICPLWFVEIFHRPITPYPHSCNLPVWQGLIKLRNLSYALIRSANYAGPFHPFSPFLEVILKLQWMKLDIWMEEQAGQPLLFIDRVPFTEATVQHILLPLLPRYTSPFCKCQYCHIISLWLFTSVLKWLRVSPLSKWKDNIFGLPSFILLGLSKAKTAPSRKNLSYYHLTPFHPPLTHPARLGGLLWSQV